MIKVHNDEYYFISKLWHTAASELDQFIKSNNIEVNEVFVESNFIYKQLQCIIDTVEFVHANVSIVRDMNLLQQKAIVVIEPNFNTATVSKLAKGRKLYIVTDMKYFIYSILRKLELLLVHIYGLSGINTKMLMNVAKFDITYGNDDNRISFSNWLFGTGIPKLEKFIDDIPYIVYHNANVDKLFYHYINTKASSALVKNMSTFCECVNDLASTIEVQRVATLSVKK